jgi:hypothetical protein
MKRYFDIPIVLGVSIGLLAGEALGESVLPHGEFVAVSPTPMPNVAITNTTAVTTVNVFDSYTPVEWKIPRDHFVVDTTGIVLPVSGKYKR